MLTDKERQEIEEEIKMYPFKSAACTEALKIVQNHRRWVSDEAISDVAEILEISAEEVDGVATFYNMIFRKPVGRNIILLCESISCYVMGYETLYEHLSKKLGIKFGETTANGRFTLLPNSCLGNCDYAPAMMINNDLYNKLTSERIDEILESYQ
jgi:NADH-quinone oxidoreductase subunit E